MQVRYKNDIIYLPNKMEKNMTSDNWRINRELAEARLKELWENGDYDQPLYLVKDDISGWQTCYHIITKKDFNCAPHWGGVKFVKAIGEDDETR